MEHASQSREKLDEDGQIFSWLLARSVSASVTKQHQEKMAELAKGLPAPRRVQGVTDARRKMSCFFRGNHKSLGEEVPRRFLTGLGGYEFPAGNSGSGRLNLAEQVANVNNPLTARVMVNRLWHHLFGRGIVASTDDFGVLGQRPSNPGFLDHLAGSFMEDGWSIKRALKRIMLSNHQQDSVQGGGRGC